MTTQYNFEKYHWGERCGKPLKSYSMNLPVSVHNRTQRPVEHRTMPNPLTPTIQALATDTRYTIGRSKKTVYSGVYCSGIYTPKGQVQYYLRTETIPSEAFEPIPFDSNAWNNRYLKELRSLSADASQLLAEIDETAELIWSFTNITLDIVNCMYNPWMCARAMKHIRKYANWKSIPSAVLLNNFAITPNVQALNDIVLKLKDENYSLYRKVEFKLSNSDTIGGAYWQASRHMVVKTKLNVKLRDDGFISRINLGNPLEWAWERIPFSFVVDWVLPVGNFVQAIGTLSRIDHSYGTRSIQCFAHATGTDSSASASGYNLESGFSADFKSHQREIVGAAAMPDVFQMVRSKSLARLSSAISLLTLLRAR